MVASVAGAEDEHAPPRIKRGRDLWQDRWRLFRRCGNGAWTVPASKGERRYRVTLVPDPTCECYDFNRHNWHEDYLPQAHRITKPCKHIYAAEIAEAHYRRSTA